MKLYSHPILKFRTKDRLHISKELGLFSWGSLLAIGILGIIADYYIIPGNLKTLHYAIVNKSASSLNGSELTALYDYFLLQAGFLSMCLILSLNLLKTWDLIMDREENLGTMIHRSMYHVFSIRVPEENVERFPLTAVTSVVLISDTVIEIAKRNGTSTKITSESSDYKALKKLRKEISSFLCLERIEYIENSDKIFYEWDLEPWITSSGISDTQDSDNETQGNQSVQEESQSQAGSNIKTLTGFS